MKIERLRYFFFQPVDPSSLGLFRLIFGALMGWFCFKHLANNWVMTKYLIPDYFFTFPLFDILGLKPLSVEGMYHLFKIMGISACCIALGLFYRVALPIFFMCFGYIFLLEKTYYNNHYYLILLITFLLYFMDAHKWASIDSLRNSQWTKQKIPYWNIFILRAQIVIVYFFAGITKINKDYLDGKQMYIWLVKEQHLSFLQPWISSQTGITLLTYGGLFIDLAIGFLLWYRPTRLFAFFVAITFHMTNKFIFGIGIFHYFMIGALILFVEPQEPRLLWNQITSFFKKSKASDLTEGPAERIKPGTTFGQNLTVVFLIIYLLVQILFPLRHLLIPSNVNWTREGHRFSWRLKSNVTSSFVNIMALDPETEKSYLIFPLEEITYDQYLSMSDQPDMILQYVDHVEQRLKNEGMKNPIIKVDSRLSVNGRPFYPLTNRDIDLSEKKYEYFGTNDWLMPPPPDL